MRAPRPSRHQKAGVVSWLENTYYDRDPGTRVYGAGGYPSIDVLESEVTCSC